MANDAGFPLPQAPFAPGPARAGLGTVRLPFDNSYARLPERFYARLAPTAVAAPRLIRLNRPLALQLGLDPEALASRSGSRPRWIASGRFNLISRGESTGVGATRAKKLAGSAA